MLTRWRLTRPVIGASTWVNSMLSLAALVDDGFGDCAGLHQSQPAVEFAFGQFRLGARVRKLAIGLQRDRLERTGIDHVKQIAGMDDGAVAEFDIGDEAA